MFELPERNGARERSPASLRGGRLLLETLPVHLALLLIVGLTLSSVLPGLARVEPASPWEAGLLLEGVRSMLDQPVYEPAESGHATAMYGPLMAPLLGALYGVFGVHLVIGRLANLTAMLLVALLVGRVFAGPTRWGLAAGCILVLGAHNKAMEFGIATRPDMLSHALGLVALLAFFRGYQRREIALYTVGVLCLVLGLLFKQTAAVLSFVPLLAIATRRDIALRTRLVYGLSPLAGILATVVVIALFHPNVYHYMFWLPRQYDLFHAQFPFYLFGMVASCSLFLWAFLDWLMGSRGDGTDERERWLLCALAVTIPASTLFVAKVGGCANSLYMGLVCMLAFCVYRLDDVRQRVLTLRPAARFAGCLALALLMVASTVPVHPIYLYGMYMAPRPVPPAPFAGRYATDPVGQAYLDTIDFVRSLPGRTVSFDEPTITWFARRELGRTMALEMDNVPTDGTYSRRVPDYVAAELADADYVVSFPTVTPYPETAAMEIGVKEQFQLLRSFGPFHVWQRRRP